VLVEADDLDAAPTGGGAAPRPEHAERRVAPPALFAENERFLKAYASDGSVKIERAPANLGTFAVDLEKGTLYYEPTFFSGQGYPPEAATFATLHELEHVREYKELAGAEGGATVWRRHRARLKSAKRYKIADNCFDDIKMNRSVGIRAPSLAHVPGELYPAKLFPGTDYAESPRHLQLSYALLREAMVPGQVCQVAPEVRAAIEGLRAHRLASGKVVDLVATFSDPSVPMAKRVEFQERFLYPLVDKFFEQDLAERNEEGKQKKGKGGGQEGQGESGEGDGNPREPAEGETGESPGEGEEGSAAEPASGDGQGGEPSLGEEAFSDDYADYDARAPQPIPAEDLEKEIEKAIEAARKGKVGADPLRAAREAYAREQGVSEKDLESYRAFWREVETIEDPETGEGLVDSLRRQIERLVSRRKKRVRAPRYPVDEGDALSLPAEAHAAVAAGETEAAVWEVTDRKLREERAVGAFDFHVVADRSGSMEGEKLRQQRLAVAAVLEALAELVDELERQAADLDEPLSVRTECRAFGDVEETVKALSPGLTERQRVAMFGALGTAPGSSTRDFLSLEAILAGIDADTEAELRAGKRRKVVVVTTDGESNGDPDAAGRVRRAAAALREKGALVIGVGVTEDGRAAIETYAPDGRLAPTAEALPGIFRGILDEALRGL